MKILVLIALFVLLLSSILERIKIKRRRYRIEGTPFPVEPTSSLLSQAIVEILAVAGGIYLALVMVTAFLQIDLSGKIAFGSVRVDCLAFLALLLAFLQPFLLRIFALGNGK